MSAASPFSSPIDPMLAKIAEALPEGEGFLFEPKWDGFRAIVFRSPEGVVIQSRDGKPLNRYFPELEKVLAEQLPKGSIVDLPPAASRSKATKPAGVSLASRAMRDAAGWMRCCKASKSSPFGPATTISPSRMQPLGNCSASTFSSSGK